MQIDFRGKNLDLTEALKDYASKRLNRLDRYFDKVGQLEVSFSVENNPRIKARNRVEVTSNLPGGGTLRAEEAAEDMYAAVDLVVEKLERQVKKYKERLGDKHRAPTARDVANASPGPAPAPEPGSDGDARLEIVRKKRFAMRPMTPEDAALQMEALGHAFFVFKDLETEAICVIYKRRDERYGLIETR
jgi:putative sigma-54 modulation protein